MPDDEMFEDSLTDAVPTEGESVPNDGQGTNIEEDLLAEGETEICA